MTLRLRPGSPPQDAAGSLRSRANEAGNAQAGHYEGGGLLKAYLNWAMDAVRMLANHFDPAAVRDLIYTDRYWALQRSAEGVIVDLIPAHVIAELSDQQRLLYAQAERIEADHARWQRGHLVVPDTSALIHGPQLWEWEPAQQLELRDTPVQIVLPIQVLDELDNLKESTKPHTRNRARQTLNWLSTTMGNRQSTRVRQGFARETPNGFVVRGDLYLDVLLDDPGHRRLPIADDEIVDRAAAVEAIAGRQVTLVTNDHGQAYRAAFASIQVVMVTEPVYDIDVQEQVRQAKNEVKQRQREADEAKTSKRKQSGEPLN